MYICMMYVVATNLAFVTPTCFVNEETMIEPAALTYVYDMNELPATVPLDPAPQPYINYWRLMGAKPSGQWNPDNYVRITPRGVKIVHEPWRSPRVRTFHRHYEKYENHLSYRSGENEALKWRVNRKRAMNQRQDLRSPSNTVYRKEDLRARPSDRNVADPATKYHRPKRKARQRKRPRRVIKLRKGKNGTRFRRYRGIR